MSDTTATRARPHDTADRRWVLRCSDGAERHRHRFDSIAQAERWAVACTGCAGPHRIVDPDITEDELATRWNREP